MNNLPLDQFSMTPSPMMPNNAPLDMSLPPGPFDPNTAMDKMGTAFDDITSRADRLNLMKNESKNKVVQYKIELLKVFYDSLRKMGIDPNNPEAIKKFLDTLGKQDPDLLKLFEMAFSELSPDAPTAFDENPMVSQGLTSQELTPSKEPAAPLKGFRGLMQKAKNVFASKNKVETTVPEEPIAPPYPPMMGE